MDNDGTHPDAGVVTHRHVGLERRTLPDLYAVPDRDVAPDGGVRGEFAVRADLGVMTNMDALHQPGAGPDAGRLAYPGVHGAGRLHARAERDLGVLGGAAVPVPVLRGTPHTGERIDHTQLPANGAGDSAATVV